MSHCLKARGGGGGGGDTTDDQNPLFLETFPKLLHSFDYLNNSFKKQTVNIWKTIIGG